MKKVLLNPQPLICAPPTVLVGTMVEGKPNFMAVAWCGVANSEPADGLRCHPAGTLYTERNPNRRILG